MYSRTKPTVYIVHWPERNVIKCGYSERQRWRPFVLRGALVVDLIEFDTSSDAFEFESVVHEVLSQTCQSAFNSADEAVDLLGGRGGGHCECFVLPPGITPIRLLQDADWTQAGAPL